MPTQTNTGYEYDYTLAGPTLRLSNDSQNQVIVTGPATTEANPSAQRIVIQGQRGFGVWSTSTYTVGEGGDVYIWGGTGGESQDWTGGRTGGSGGDVKLRGGQGQDNDGGYVRIEGGNTEIYNNTSTGYGGFVEITGGDVVGQAGDPSDPSKGGDVRITGGRAYSASTLSGVVQVITGGTTNPDVFGANTWTFSNAGTLTLPSDGIIQSVDNNGRLRSQLRLDEGSDITRLSGWSSPDSQSFTTSDWTTGTYTNNAGAGVIAFTGAENIISWLNANNYADRVFFTVNGGPQMESTGWGGGVSDITFNVATPPVTSPTTVTSFSIYYQFESRLDIDTDDQEFYILSTNNDLYLETRQSGNIQLNSVEDLDLVGNGIVNLRNNSTSTGIQIRTDDGDHIWNFGVDGTLTLPSVGKINNGANTWTFSNAGALTLPEGSILSGTRENVTVTLDQFNDGGFTGTQVFSKVSDILYQVLPSGPTMELVSGVWYLKVDVATYYNSADLITWAESAGGLPTPVGTIGTLATTNLTLDANTWTFSGNGALTIPGVLIKSTVAKTGGGVGTETAIDLTKSVNKLTTGTYTLADGVEGQIMYLVRQTTATTAVTVTVANSRLDGFMQTDIPFTPFTDGTDPTNMATLIFTDSAWQSMGGFWNLT